MMSSARPSRHADHRARLKGFAKRSAMLITVFRSRLKPEAQEEYLQWASRMSDLAKSMPGYLAHKGFVADDGERVAIVEFASEEAQRSWAKHPEHLAAQRKGRQDFYREFRVQVCTVQRESSTR
jgi:heme-degrading monooxygenase HmoA